MWLFVANRILHHPDSVKDVRPHPVVVMERGEQIEETRRGGGDLLVDFDVWVGRWSLETD